MTPVESNPVPYIAPVSLAPTRPAAGDAQPFSPRSYGSMP
jgi:hypothetical protein